MSDTNIDTKQERKPQSKKVYTIRQVEKISYAYEVEANSWKEAEELWEEGGFDRVDGSDDYEDSNKPYREFMTVKRTCSFDNGRWKKNSCKQSWDRNYDHQKEAYFYDETFLHSIHGYLCRDCFEATYRSSEAEE